jgi:hypothetical protein
VVAEVEEVEVEEVEVEVVEVEVEVVDWPARARRAGPSNCWRMRCPWQL